MDAEFWENIGSHRVQCNLCSVDLATGFLQSHLETQYNTFRSFALRGQEEEEERDAVTHYTMWDILNGWFHCSVEDCPGGDTTLYNLHQHFST